MHSKPVLQFHIQLPIDEAELAVRKALQSEGFGILTEVDFAAVLKSKIGVTTKPHRLLGACNPRLAHLSLEAVPAVGVFLPCGVTVREGDTPETTIVEIQNPAMLTEAFDTPALDAPATEALQGLRAALLAAGATE